MLNKKRRVVKTWSEIIKDFHKSIKNEKEPASKSIIKYLIDNYYPPEPKGEESKTC